MEQAAVEQKGTKELTEVVDLGLAGVDAFIKIKADGKVDLNDLPLALNFLTQIGPALDKIDQVPAEIKDLSVEEASALTAHVMAKLSIGEEAAIEKINAVFGLLIAGLRCYKAFA